MKRTWKALAAMMLIVTAIIVAGCNKPDEPNNGGLYEEVPEGAIN